MGHDKRTRREDIVTLFGVYDIPMKLQAGQIDQAADFGRDAIFFDIFEQYKHLFRESEQFDHGDAWPFGFMALAKRQYFIDDDDVVWPCRLAHVSELPQFQRNDRIKGTATAPVLYLADRKFYFEPPTMEGVFIEYFKYPNSLADYAIEDDETDTMPEAVEPLIARAGFERALKMQVDDDVALKLTHEEYQQTTRGIEKLFAEKFIEQTKSPLKEDQS